ncbi:MAG: efflux RND transporter periplasmic adaptor subunit, partial [Acidobacteriota bacterium]
GTVTTLSLAALLLASCAKPEQAASPEGTETGVMLVRRASLPDSQSVAGTVRSETTSTLAANVVGTVVRVRVFEGDRVRAGDVLVEIDARESRASAERTQAGREEVERAIEGAAANSRLAAATAGRITTLNEQGIASEQSLDEARAALAAAQAELARLTARRGEASAAQTQAEAVLAYSSIRSPIDGVVTARLVDPGAQAAPGVPLVTIEGERATRVDASVPETVLVRIGDLAAVEAGGRRVDARVTHVQPSVDSGARSSLVKLVLQEPLRAGTYVKVSFSTGTREAVTVPRTSLVQRGQLTSVFVVGDDRVARMRLVTTGAMEGPTAEVLSGLEAGETIVSAPSLVRDGMVIRSNV